MIAKIVSIIIVLNALVGIVVRILHGGRVDLVRIGAYSANSAVTNYRIAGINSQPEKAFQYINLPKGNVIDARYSPLGFAPKSAAMQIENFAARHPTKHTNVFGVSIGAMTMMDIEKPGIKTVAINPCMSIRAVNSKLRAPVVIGAILTQTISITLGTISLLPVIPAEAGKYSIALWADLLWVISFNSNPRKPTNVIWSKNDELLDYRFFTKNYEKKCICEIIESAHARIGDPDEAKKYQDALNKFF